MKFKRLCKGLGWAALSAVMGLAGCGPSITGGANPSSYLNTLGSWESLAPPVSATPTSTEEAREQGLKSGDTRSIGSGDPLFNPSYNCKSTPYTLATTPWPRTPSRLSPWPPKQGYCCRA